MLVERDKLEINRWSSFLGTNMAALQGKNPELDLDASVPIIPLTTVINPELMKQLSEENWDAQPNEEIDPAQDEAYERMAEEMARTGKLTVIENMFPDVEKRVHDKKLQRAGVRIV